MRLIDVFDLKIGSTQLAGAESLSIVQEFATVSADNDGYQGQAEEDKTRYMATAELGFQDLITLDDAIAAFEAAVSATVSGRGKTVGVLAGGAGSYHKFTMNRMLLAGANFSIGNGLGGAYATAGLSLVNAPAPASTDPSAEIAIAVETAAITHSTAKRGVSLVSAVHGGSLTPVGVEALTWRLQGKVEKAAGDGDFGEAVEVVGYTISGTLSFKDHTIGSSQTIAQRLIAGGRGALVCSYKQSGGGSNGTITLNNLQFKRDSTTLAARRMGVVQVDFSQQWSSGSTEYKLATGSNKLLAVA